MQSRNVNKRRIIPGDARIHEHYIEKMVIRYCSLFRKRCFSVPLTVVFYFLLFGNSASAQLFNRQEASSLYDDCWCFYVNHHCAAGDLSLGLNLQFGSIHALQIDASYYITPNWQFSLSYQGSMQNYISRFITEPCLECDINFHSISAGVGYEWYRCWDKFNGFFIVPGIQFGAEVVPRASLFHEHDPTTIFSYLLKPRLHVGWQHKGLGVFFGVNYTLWPYHTMTAGFQPLIDAQSDTHLNWGEDLFPGRKGVGYLIGLRYFIRRL